MNVLLVSQCTKRALVESRRILDQFAERRGDRTWQTAITHAGLETLRKLLRSTARKNTAVACHWVRGRDHTELLWVVGDARQFNAVGAVPTNTTVRDVLRREDENDWHSLALIRQLSTLAALLHDLGKATDAFQARLVGARDQGRNRLRHEWVSVRLFQAFVAEDDDRGWLGRLAQAEALDAKQFEASWLGGGAGRLWRDGLDAEAAAHLPFATVQGLPPLAQAVAWLILTHHRLPALPAGPNESSVAGMRHGRRPKEVQSGVWTEPLAQVDANWNEPWPADDTSDSQQVLAPYWQFSEGLPVRLDGWRKRVARVARSLLREPMPAQDVLTDPYVMHLARLTLMLADHHYSRLTDPVQRVKGEQGCALFANTDRRSGAPLQPLDEHLLGVEAKAALLAQALPGLKRHLSHLVGHRGLRQRASHAAFRWQDKAADLAAGVRHLAAEQGAFVVNMASTGCGKTLGNARIMNALANPASGLRCAFAMGLRTLTLQTGRSFQHMLGLDDSQLAIQVGGAASRALFEHMEQQAETSGSASRDAVFDQTTHVLYEGSDHHQVTQALEGNAQAQRLLSAPLLVCTVDHLVPATESLRGGWQATPLLRLLTGDLVLDEPDDFDLDDLSALTRLVYAAGLMGSKVLLSSATLPPALVEGLFMAYLAGRALYQRHRGQRPGEAPAVVCLWADEFTQRHAQCADVDGFRAAHDAYVQARVRALTGQVVRRRAQLFPWPTADAASPPDTVRAQFAGMVREAAWWLHGLHHQVDPKSGKRVSFGLVRMANIDPLFDVALAWYRMGAPAGAQVHLCVYHSQFPLFVRSAIEHRLDRALDRRQPSAVFDLPDIRRAIDATPAQDQLFVVLGSPVVEVGRDHDYDWAVVEPSSMRSLIQLAGRVWRHRTDREATAPNMLVCRTNLRCRERRGPPYYWRPGFETEDRLLEAHTLDALMAPWLDEQYRMVVDARPRILPRPKNERQPTRDLADLEHDRLTTHMLPPAAPDAPPRLNRLTKAGARLAQPPLNAAAIWLHKQLGLTGLLPQLQPFRADDKPTVEVVLLPDEDEEDYALHSVEFDRSGRGTTWQVIEASLNHRVPDEAVRGHGMTPWATVDFMADMAAQAQEMGLPLTAFAMKYATATLPRREQGWRWHPVLGFSAAD